MDRAFHRTRFPKLALDLSDGDWDSRYGAIADLLSQPEPRARRRRDEGLGAFAGAWRLPGDRGFVRIRAGSGGLVARFDTWLPRVRLLRVARRRFLLAGIPFEMRFRFDRSGRAQSVRIEGERGRDVPKWRLANRMLTRIAAGGRPART